MKPASIHRFETLWWGATVAWLVGMVLSWDRTRATLLANPRTAPFSGTAQVWIAVLALGWTALVWWLVARQANPVGKWLAVVTAAISGLVSLGRLAGLAAAASLHLLSLAAFLLGTVLTILACVALFRPDANEWFGLGEAESLS